MYSLAVAIIWVAIYAIITGRTKKFNDVEVWRFLLFHMAVIWAILGLVTGFK